MNLGPIDEGAMWIRAPAEAPVSRIEAALQGRGLTLGSHPPSVFEGTVGEWLEGPWAGRRAMAGRLETAVAGLGAMLPDGTWYSSIPVPRSAAGPGLDHVFLGGGGACGSIRYAWLKAELLPGRLAFVAAEGPTGDLCRLVFQGLLEDICPREIEWRIGSATIASFSFDVGTTDKQVAVEAFLARGRAVGLRTWAVGNRDLFSRPGGGERELAAGTWRDLLPGLPGGSVVLFRRITRESVAAVGGPAIEAGEPVGRGEELLGQIAAVLRGEGAPFR